MSEATENQLLTYQKICDKALDMLIASVGELPVKPKLLQGTPRKHEDVIEIFLHSGELSGGRVEVAMKQPNRPRSSTNLINPEDLSLIAEGAMGMSIDEFYDSQIKPQIGRLAFFIKEDCKDFSKCIVFGHLLAPQGTMWSGHSEREGFSLRLVCVYDVNHDLPLMRFDVIYGGL